MVKDREHAASYVNLGRRYRAGSALAQDTRLGSTYRFLTDLAMTHFGGTYPRRSRTPTSRGWPSPSPGGQRGARAGAVVSPSQR